MKRFSFFWMVTLALMLGVTMTACSQDEPLGTEPESDYYTVKLGWEGEIIDVTYEPLETRAASNDLYGIQVYSTPNNDASTPTWEAYAYGLFDDPDNISINLLKGYKYKFVATMVRDGKNKISSYNNSYHMPFRNQANERITLNNSFDYQSNIYFDRLEYGSSSLIGYDKSFSHPNTDRFYGELVDYTPGEKNATAKIDMKRTAFGAKFIANGAKAKDGTLHVQIKDAPAMELGLTTSENKISDIFTFSNVAAAWSENKYTETIDVTINWERADGTTLPLGTHAITYKRNATTVVQVKIENDGEDGGVGFEIDESETGTPFEDGENDITIEDGEIVETEVDTNGDDSESSIPNNQIWYTSTEKVEPNEDANFGSTILSNEWDITTSKGMITFNGDIDKIDDEAFSLCSALTSITIPGSVTIIKEFPFGACPNLSAFYGPLASKDNKCLVLRSVLYAFAPYGLETYNIPDNITNIGADAFSGCSNLTQVIIPEQVTTIQKFAFEGCSGLNSIIIPSNVNTIGTQAFQDCSNLKDIFCKATTPPTIPSNPFRGCSSELKIYVPAESVSVYKTADGWKEFAEQIVPYE